METQQEESVSEKYEYEISEHRFWMMLIGGYRGEITNTRYTDGRSVFTRGKETLGFWVSGHGYITAISEPDRPLCDKPLVVA